jgi:hypothetical protein
MPRGSRLLVAEPKLACVSHVQRRQAMSKRETSFNVPPAAHFNVVNSEHKIIHLQLN